MFRQPRPPRLASLAAAALVGLAACGPTLPTPAPTADPSATPRPAAEVYAEIRAAIEAIRGLEPTSDVEPVSITPDQVAVNLAAEFDAEHDAAELADTEAVLVALGLLPEGSSLRDLTLDFQSGQVAGYYSPDKDQLFVVNRATRLDASEQVTYAHEFTHQLQDQNLDLDALGVGANDQGDRSLAALALIEGDAVSAQTAWMEANLGPEELGELLAVALSPASIEALRRAPPYLRETAIFPYRDGAAFVARLLADGGYEAVNAAYENPPDSTEQVFHPDKYLQRDPPIAVRVPEYLAPALDPGWLIAAEDTLGELYLRIWLREGGVPLAQARASADGWGGDRIALLRGPGGATTVLLVSEWDTLADALEFATAAKDAVAGLQVDGRVALDERAPTVYVAIGAIADEVMPRFFGN